ncbi:hypothetical protein LOK49_LG13G00823 [Camellia lanceoleosa]|uniref:Uncharacterized protein n=1 Tax=Camellia lanceoleosa TaxID=1840588 RepID=A0ACC0FJH1_9ERIC|nr:hypothetical protein LOK49_LG13G00823 [Camellia lanceoleosa]
MIMFSVNECPICKSSMASIESPKSWGTA